jgi:predicted PurR-regulated permease PerM
VFRDHVRAVLGWTLLAVLAYAALLTVWPFVVPLAWAAILATVFYPLFERLELKCSATWSAATVTLLATLVVVGPLFVVSTLFVREAVQAISTIQNALADGRFAWVQHTLDAIQDRVTIVEHVDVAAVAAEAAKRSALLVASHSGAVIRNVGGFVFDLVVALFATFFLLRDGRSVISIVRRVLPMNVEFRDRLIAQVHQLVSVSVTSSLLVAAVQGFLGGAVFALVGISAPVFWGVVIGLFCLLPLGAWLIWMPAALLLALDGSVGRAAVVAGLGFGVVSAVDNVLRPALLSGGAQMNGLVILVALLGGIGAFGPLGVVIGPIVLATAISLLTAYASEADVFEIARAGRLSSK